MVIKPCRDKSAANIGSRSALDVLKNDFWSGPGLRCSGVCLNNIVCKIILNCAIYPLVDNSIKSGPYFKLRGGFGFVKFSVC